MDVTSGLKKGCLMSPFIFNLIINDIVTPINNSDIGLNIGGRKISMLLYADYIILMANGARYLKWMSDMLAAGVNHCKTKVMQFRP